MCIVNKSRRPDLTSMYLEPFIQVEYRLTLLSRQINALIGVDSPGRGLRVVGRDR